MRFMWLNAMVIFMFGLVWLSQPVIAQDDFSAEPEIVVTESLESAQLDTPTDDSTAQNTESDGANADESDLEDELAEITDDYFTQVEDYRDVERRYIIARETYYQNNTLAAQEEAIRQAQFLMIARSTVLETYFEYLQKSLDQTLGIELEDKVLMNNRLAKVRTDLEESLVDAGKDRNRFQINEAFTALNAQQKELTAIAYETLALVKIGQLQNALDQATISREMISSWLESAQTTEANRIKKQRGLEEVDHLIQSAKNNLTEVNTKWRLQAGTNRFSESSYRTFQENSEYTYLQLRQALAFMEEIVRTP
jgi:hypothetical protein